MLWWRYRCGRVNASVKLVETLEKIFFFFSFVCHLFDPREREARRLTKVVKSGVLFTPFHPPIAMHMLSPRINLLLRRGNKRTIQFGSVHIDSLPSITQNSNPVLSLIFLSNKKTERKMVLRLIELDIGNPVPYRTCLHIHIKCITTRKH